MKHLILILTASLMLLLCSCSKNTHIPEISILDEIPSLELSDILDYEREHPVDGFSFKEMYPKIRNIVREMDEIDKANYVKLTYRELFNAQCAVDDTTRQASYRQKWKKKYDALLPQAKNKAQLMTQEILISYRVYAYKTNSFGYSSFRTWCRRNGYHKFLSPTTIGPQDITENSWDYMRIITDLSFASTDFQR